MSNILNAMIALAGCSIAAALTIEAPMSAAGTPATMPASAQVAMPASDSRSLLDQRVVRAPGHEPRMQRPASVIIVPIGQGWG